VDVEPDTLNICPQKIEQALKSQIPPGSCSRARAGNPKAPTSKFQSPTSNFQSQIKAIMPVHLYGHPCDMDPILELAREYGLAVVEDAAHALPARYKGRFIGSSSLSQSLGEGLGMGAEGVRALTAFSFYATKNLTTGEGGMLVGDAEIVERARPWSLHGMNHDAYNRYGANGSWYYEVVLPGFKCNMTDIQAALGLHQLRKLPAFQERRCAIVAQYDRAFGEVEALQLPARRPEVEHAWHIYALRLRLEQLTISRERFIEELKARRIGASVHFIPIHLHPYYRQKYGFCPEDFPLAHQAYQQLVSLPLNPRMTDDDVADVVEAVLDIVRLYRR
jgi:dTDP-4-amino-4,6-dideoxygalactose transaminase